MSVRIDKATELQIGEVKVDLVWTANAYKRFHKFPLDLAAVSFTETAALDDAAYRERLIASKGSIRHSGCLSAIASERNGSDVSVIVDLSSLPSDVAAIVLLINAFDSGPLSLCDSLHFRLTQNMENKCAIFLPRATLGNSKGLILGAIFKHPKTGAWNFAASPEKISGRHYTACMQPIRSIVSKLIGRSNVAKVLQVDKTIDMHKGDQLTIPTSVTKLIIGLGWETTTENLDLDASCVLLNDVDGDGDLDPIDAVYFLQKDKPGIHSTGDNRTGEGGWR